VLFISFYTRIFRGRFLSLAKNRLFNAHPSILPACPGRNGFEDTLKARAKFVGATIHLVDSGIDSGAPIIQSAAPFNPRKTIEENRHIVFVQQCKMVLQVIKWAEEERILFLEDGSVEIKNANYEAGEFAPNMEIDIVL
jgi:phosphoribosylglycinamide formyltransferase-1